MRGLGAYGSADKACDKIACMATTKMTVTVPEELGAYIRERVAAGEFESVSAFITRAAENLRDFDPLDLLIASMIAETGEPDDQAEAWARDAMAKAQKALRARRGEQAA
jgi:Arc/MetJ-type ribon-helix-helix transcriptional regulator